MSTVVLARLLRQYALDGTITSLEHDADWVDLVTDLLRRESLSHIARVVHAPLEGTPPWYTRSALGQSPEAIDLLIIDGPPAFAAGHERRRAPALEAFDDRLTADASVFLDDIDRPGEQQVLAEWQQHLDWRFTIDTTAGIAHGTRQT